MEKKTTGIKNKLRYAAALKGTLLFEKNIGQCVSTYDNYGQP